MRKIEPIADSLGYNLATMWKWLVILCLVAPVAARTEEPWTWKDGKGEVRSETELDKILKEHKDWVHSGGQKGAQAKLLHADLHKASLASVDLRGADLTGANLEGADLTEAKLANPSFASNDPGKQTKLTGAVLIDADLTQADLSGADLSQARFKGAYLGGYGEQIDADCAQDPVGHGKCWRDPLCGKDLRRNSMDGAQLCAANLTGADLTDVDLTQADLTRAKLRSAVMTGAQLEYANVRGASYEPFTSPPASSIGLAANLAELDFADDPEPIAALRNVLQAAGFEQQGRDVNRAYHRHAENVVQRVLFDLTCAWGAEPLRPLIIVAVLTVICTFVYLIVMHMNLKFAGLYLIPGSEGEGQTGTRERALRIGVLWGWFGPMIDEESRLLVADTSTGRPAKTRRGLWRWLRLELVATRIALLFSLMSVFTIGVEGLDGRQWMRMMQPYDFDIRARGWVRTASGLQSLLGSGLLALSLLSYFGHPFW